MRQRDHRAGWLRRSATYVAAFALLFHVAAMALGAGHLPGLASPDAQAQVHAHHAASAADHDPGMPKDGAEHKPPCCILSLCPGLPSPPSDHVLAFLPQQEASALVYGVVRQAGIPRLPVLPPVGARAPPALV